MEEEQKLVQRSSVLSRLQMSPMRHASQHLLWKNHLGFLLHPNVALNMEPGSSRVAEIGTRTGLWLLDMARKLPEVKLDGFAIDTSSAPSPQWLPPNVRLRQVDNFTDDLLKGEQEAYDIVRIANLAGFIVDNNPGPVIQNAMAMLKPGGYIEWDELDSAHHGVVRSTSTAPSPRIHELLRCVHDHEHALGPRGWINSLPDILARHGLQVPLGQHRYRLPLAYAKVDNDTWFEEFEALSYRLESQEHGNELRRLMIAAKEACAKDEQAVTADLVIAVGRKVY